MLLSETTKKIKQDIGEKEIPPMLDNTFWGNREIETQSLKKISVINKKISLIEKAIRRIVKSFISLNNFSDQLDGLEGNAPGAPKKGLSRVAETPVKPADWSFLGKLIAAGMVLFLGYKIVEYVVKHIISPIINGFTKVINSVIGIFAAATNGFISVFAMTIKAATNSVVSFINLSTELYYSSAIGLAKIHKSITGNTAEIEKQIEDLRKEKISTQAATTAAGKSVTTEIETEKNVAISAVTSTAAGAETAVTAAGTSVISAVTPPPLPDIFAGIGGMVTGGGAQGKGSFGGGGATGNITTDPYKGQQILSGSIYDAIIAAEGTAKYGDPYNTSLGYEKSPKPLTSMTMKESLEWGDYIRKRTKIGIRSNSSAKGAFQIVNTTQKDAMKALGIGDNELFDEENQKRLAAWIWNTQGWRAWEGLKIHPEILASIKDFNNKKVAVPVSSSSNLNTKNKNNTVIVVNNPPPKPPKKKPPTQKYAVVDRHDYFGADDRNHIPLSLQPGT